MIDVWGCSAVYIQEGRESSVFPEQDQQLVHVSVWSPAG